MDAGVGVEPDVQAAADDPFVRPRQPRQTPKDGRLAAPGWAEQNSDRKCAGRLPPIRLDRSAARKPLLEPDHQVVVHGGTPRFTRVCVPHSTANEKATMARAVCPAAA